MRDNWIPKTATSYSNYLSRLREKRKAFKKEFRKIRVKRGSLTKTQRQHILQKTDSRCHICGGIIRDKWQADHVLSYSKGGIHTEDNYLPAHPICNNYRWDYDPEEFQEIMKLGVWIRTQIIKQTSVGKDAADRFIKYERKRTSRRK